MYFYLTYFLFNSTGLYLENIHCEGNIVGYIGKIFRLIYCLLFLTFF